MNIQSNIRKRYLLIVCLSVFTISRLQAQDTTYYYDVTHYSFNNNDFKRGKFEVREGVMYNKLLDSWADSTNISIAFTDNVGSMKFYKYFNGVLYLEGQYTSSEVYKVDDKVIEDAETGKTISRKKCITFYPRKSGAWKLYRDGQQIDVIQFE